MKILIIEDEAKAGDYLRQGLSEAGYVTDLARDGADGLHHALTADYDLLVLDVMLPGPSGLEILRSVRQHDRATPILLLTARGSEADKVLGLELGADDYVTKPFSLRELRARVRAQLRRRDALHDTPGVSNGGSTARFAIGDADVDLAAYELRRGGTTHRLSPTEAAMLGLLWRERGRVVDRSMFLREVWNGASIGDRTIDTHLLHLRKKLERDPRAPRHLLTVHGVGYRLQVEA